MNILSKREIETLASLLRRAIGKNQVQIQVASPISDGEPDEFEDGDRHDGNSVSSDMWKISTGDEMIMLCGPDAGDIRPCVTLLLDSHSIKTLTK